MLELIQTTHRNAAQLTHHLQRIEAPRPLEHSAAPAAGAPAVAMDAEIFLATGVDRGFWNIVFLPLNSVFITP